MPCIPVYPYGITGEFLWGNRDKQLSHMGTVIGIHNVHGEIKGIDPVNTG
jgi:hypothetical protein